MKIEYLLLNGLGLKSLKNDSQTLHKKWSRTVTQELAHNCYSKLVHNCFSKSDPQRLLKNRTTNVTQKVIHKRYSKIDPETLLKKRSTNITNLFNPWKHDYTLKIQKDCTLKIQKDSAQKSFLTHFMLLIFFNPSKNEKIKSFRSVEKDCSH